LLSPPLCLFFYVPPAPPAIFTLSLHDALPVDLHEMHGLGREFPRPDGLRTRRHDGAHQRRVHVDLPVERAAQVSVGEDAEDAIARIDHHGHSEPLARSEEHTSELQSLAYL